MRYEMGEVIGKGLYGAVMSARPKYVDAPCAQVAVKRMENPNLKKCNTDSARRRAERTHEYYIKREIEVMRVLSHENVTLLIEVAKDNLNQVYFVFPQARQDLHTWINSDAARVAAPGQVKSYALQLISGVAYCHANNIIHRDLKPHNILIMPNNVIKVADFGLATIGSNGGGVADELTNYVITRYYRPPELCLLLSGNERKKSTYTDRVDVWSVGCIIVEMLTGNRLFVADTDAHLLTQVWLMRGTPSLQQWPADTREACRASVHSSTKHNVDSGRQAFGERVRRVQAVPRLRLLTRNAIDMIHEMLVLNPMERAAMCTFTTAPYFVEETPKPYDPQCIVQYGTSYFVNTVGGAGGGGGNMKK